MKTLKEIAEQLKNAREEKGVSIEEAAEDLNLKASQIKSIEDVMRRLLKMFIIWNAL